MTEKTKHIHKLKRLRYKSGNDIFFCALPDCTFKTNISLALGKRSICWRCGEPFIMNEYSLRLSKPHCDNCHKPKVDKADISKTIHTDENGVSFDIRGYVTDIKAPEQSLADRLGQAIEQANKQIQKEEEEI